MSCKCETCALGRRVDELLSKVTALEAWARDSYISDHRLAPPPNWKGCQFCNGLTVGTCSTCDKRICSNHVSHCDTCKAAPPAPVAEPVTDEQRRQRARESGYRHAGTYRQATTTKASSSDMCNAGIEPCEVLCAMFDCKRWLNDVAKPETAGPGPHPFDDGGSGARALCVKCAFKDSHPIHAKDVGR